MNNIILLVVLLVLILLISNSNSNFGNNNQNNQNNQNIINVLFLVRDGEKYLLNNLNQIDFFCKKHFKDYKIIFLENNSVDSTVDILKLKMSENKKISGVFKNLPVDHSTKLCPGEDINCNKRTRFLASLRQEVLDLSLKHNSDITMMCDLDFISFDSSELLKMINILIEKKLDGIFGMSYKEDGSTYDTGAISPFDQSLFNKIVNGESELIKVVSAFSGFGVYNTKSIIEKKAKYNLDTNAIEHIDFNKNFDNIYVYTKFKPVY